MPFARTVIPFGIPLIVIGGATILFFLNPSDYSFFPKCTFHNATGYSCPGCGSTRALFNLTNGNISVTANIVPLEMHNMCKLASLGKTLEAQKINMKIDILHDLSLIHI